MNVQLCIFCQISFQSKMMINHNEKLSIWRIVRCQQKFYATQMLNYSKSDTLIHLVSTSREAWVDLSWKDGPYIYWCKVSLYTWSDHLVYRAQRDVLSLSPISPWIFPRLMTKNEILDTNIQTRLFKKQHYINCLYFWERVFVFLERMTWIHQRIG